MNRAKKTDSTGLDRFMARYGVPLNLKPLPKLTPVPRGALRSGGRFEVGGSVLASALTAELVRNYRLDPVALSLCPLRVEGLVRGRAGQDATDSESV